MLSTTTQEILVSLGQRIRQARLARNETQKRFAARLGVSRPTLQRLEGGNPKVSLGLFADALCLLGHEEELCAILAPKDDLFARWDQEQAAAPTRQRATAEKRRSR